MEINKLIKNNMKMENQKIEHFKGEFLHPAIDVKDNLLVLGFRYITRDLNENNLFLRTTKEEGWEIKLFEENYFELSGKQYFIEDKNRLLPKIEERWSLEELINFVNDYNLIKIPTPEIEVKVLFDKIEELLKEYMELENEEDYDLLSSWIIGTYFFPCFSTYPFLHIKAPKNSGKTQCLNFLQQVCFNAVKARPTLAAFTDKWTH